MDSSVPHPQQKPPRAEHYQPRQPFEFSHPQIQDSYYHYPYNGSEPAAGLHESQYSYSPQVYGPAFQQRPQHASGPIITAPPQIPGQPGAYAVPPGLNPAAAAAVAAFSELSEFAGNMARQEAANGALTGPGPGPLHYYRPQNGRGFSRRGRGRGRGRGGHMRRGQDTGSPNPTPASETEMSSAKNQATGPPPSRKPVPQIFWCELCMVDCNTLDTLEQHKNGRRHKKTVKKLEEMQAWKKQLLENEAGDTENDTSIEPQNLSEQRIDSTNKSDMNIPAVEEKNILDGHQNLEEATPGVEKRENVKECRLNFQEAKVSTIEERENVQEQIFFPAETVINKTDLDNLLQTQSTDPQCGGMEEKLTSEQSKDASSFPSRGGHTGRKPSKRKMMGFGRGEKRARQLERMGRRPPEKPRERPIVCTICSITCDTQAVFQTHLVGRKHTARAKRLQGQQPTSGSPGYFHENPTYVHTSQGPAPIFYGFHPLEVSQSHDPMQDAPLEFQTGKTQCQETVESVAEPAESVNPGGLTVIPDSDVENVKSAEHKSVTEGDDIK